MEWIHLRRNKENTNILEKFVKNNIFFLKPNFKLDNTFAFCKPGMKAKVICMFPSIQKKRLQSMKSRFILFLLSKKKNNLFSSNSPEEKWRKNSLKNHLQKCCSKRIFPRAKQRWNSSRTKKETRKYAWKNGSWTPTTRTRGWNKIYND